MDGHELIEGAALIKAAVDAGRTIWPFLRKKGVPLPPGCPGPNFMPVYRPKFCEDPEALMIGYSDDDL
jgi:hypothetical protein